MAKDKKGVWTPDPSMIRMAGDPPPQPSPEEITLMEAIGKEHQSMRNSVLAIMQEWSRLEGEMSQVLAAAADIRDPVIASQIFFASNNSHTQQKMLDGVISHLRRYHHPNSPLLPEFEKVVINWKALRSRHNQLKEFRDAAAHRVITTISVPEQGQHVVLALSGQNLAGMLKSYDNDTLLQFTSAKMEKASREVGQLLADLTGFLQQLRQHIRALGVGMP